MSEKAVVWDTHAGYAKSTHVTPERATVRAERENAKHEARLLAEYRGGPLQPLPRYVVREVCNAR